MASKINRHIPKTVVLSNGVRVVFDIDHGHPTAAIGVLVGSGSRYESDSESGLSHFMEHMMFKGTEKRSTLEISSAIENVGGGINAFTSAEYTVFEAAVPSKHVGLALDVLADMILHPLFKDEEIQNERSVVEQEIFMHNDRPSSIMLDRLLHVAYGDNPTARNALGTIENVRSFTHDDFVRHYRRYFTASRIVVSLAGDVNVDAVVKALEQTFGHIPDGPGTTRFEAVKWNSGTVVTQKPIEQVHLAMALPAYAMNDPMSPTLFVLSSIFGGGMSSRLFQRIREKEGLVYSIGSTPMSSSSEGMLGISAMSSPDNAERVQQLVVEEVDRMQQSGITKDELAHTRESLLGNILMQLESFHNRMMRNLEDMYTNGKTKTVDEVCAEVNNVTMEGAVAVIGNVFVPANLAVSIVRK